MFFNREKITFLTVELLNKIGIHEVIAFQQNNKNPRKMNLKMSDTLLYTAIQLLHRITGNDFLMLLAENSEVLMNFKNDN